MAKKFIIYIAPDSNAENAKKEQFRYYQKDGQTCRVAIGKQQEVAQWVAETAKKVGDIADYIKI